MKGLDGRRAQRWTHAVYVSLATRGRAGAAGRSRQQVAQGQPDVCGKKNSTGPYHGSHRSPRGSEIQMQKADNAAGETPPLGHGGASENGTPKAAPAKKSPALSCSVLPQAPRGVEQPRGGLGMCSPGASRRTHWEHVKEPQKSARGAWPGGKMGKLLKRAARRNEIQLPNKRPER